MCEGFEEANVNPLKGLCFCMKSPDPWPLLWWFGIRLIFVLSKVKIYCGKDSPSMPHQAAVASWLMVIHALCCIIFQFHMVQQNSPTSYEDLIHLRVRESTVVQCRVLISFPLKAANQLKEKGFVLTDLI